MKAGIIQAIYGLSEIREAYHVEILITADEEIGSYASRELIEERAKATGNVLVFEPSGNDDALKIARKGVGTFRVDIAGRASHAGLEPEKGINALIELAAQVQTIAAIAKPEIGTTVTPTIATAGTTENVVPATAQITVDVRVNILSEKARVESALGALQPTVAGATISVSGSINRPPMHESASTTLYAVAQSVAQGMGITD